MVNRNSLIINDKKLELITDWLKSLHTKHLENHKAQIRNLGICSQPKITGFSILNTYSHFTLQKFFIHS